jgi:hypothetical protein
MPWMVSIDALEYDLLSIEKKLKACGYGHALDIIRAEFAHPREAFYVEDTSRLQASILHVFKPDRIMPNSAAVSRKGGS